MEDETIVRKPSSSQPRSLPVDPGLEELWDHFDNPHLPKFYTKKVQNSQFLPFNVIPNSFDWRDHNAVTSVKVQGACGTCEAFTVAGALEAMYKFKTNAEHAISVSVQYLLTCTVYPPQTGIAEKCAKYHEKMYLLNSIIKNGSVLEEHYPYVSGSTGVSGECDETKARIKYPKIDQVWYIQNSEKSMKEALYRYGPLMAMMYTDWGFDHYKSGVYWSRNFEILEDEGHAVLIVGYGIDKKYGEYWTIKNSWGENWGIRLCVFFFVFFFSLANQSIYSCYR